MTGIDKTVQRYHMIKQGDRVLVALSGGSDSVCLLHLLVGSAQELGITVAAAHFSHGLRPESAQSEQDFCRELCDKLNVPLFCGAGNTPAYAKQQKRSIEDAARALRYRFLASIAALHGYTRIATAHTQDDNAETVLLNLARGAGLSGACGIPPVRGLLIRPLIETGKQEILEYLRKNNLQYITDDSNADPKYARNRVRLRVLPELEKINSACIRHIAEAAARLREVDELIAKFAQEQCGQRCDIDAQAACALSGLLFERVMRTLAHNAGGSLNSAQVEALQALCTGENPSGKVSLADGLCAKRVYDKLVFEKDSPVQAPSNKALKAGGQALFGAWRVQNLSARDLIIRTRREGDALLLNGHKKTIKKLFIEKKVPRDARDLAPVVCDGDTVLSAAGICADSAKGQIIAERVDGV